MKQKLRLIIICLAAASPAFGQGSFVQKTSSFAPQSGTTCVTGTLTGQATGNINFVGIEYGVGVTISSVASANGNTYVLDAGPIQGGLNSGTTWVALYRASNIASGSEHATVNLSGSVSGKCDLLEYRGALTSSPLDQTATGQNGSGASATLSAGPVTTTQANEIMVAIGRIDAATTLTPGTSFTLRDSDGSSGSQSVGVIDYTFTNSAGSYTATISAATSANWEIAFATYKTSNTTPNTDGKYTTQVVLPMANTVSGR
jgi:hypothetical protein